MKIIIFKCKRNTLLLLLQLKFIFSLKAVRIHFPSNQKFKSQFLKILPRFGEREFVVIRCSFPEREIRLRCYHGRRAKERS